MKTLKYISIFLFAVTQFSNTYSQTSNSSENVVKIDTIKVSGNCESCKTRIEKAARIDGVKKANWDIESKLLIVEFNPDKVKNDDIQKNVALKGHDTEKYKADDKTYNRLPACCKYR
jgi:periplasmic mercuric ion binding protein